MCIYALFLSLLFVVGLFATAG